MSLTRPEPSIVQGLLDMGFTEKQATSAALRTYNTGIESAITWLTERCGDRHNEEADAHTHRQCAEGEPSMSSGASLQWTLSEPVVGVPSDVPLVIHPDGNHAPAMVVGVGCECKMVLVVAADLGMSTGKIAAQCAHASLGLYKLMVSSNIPWLSSWEAEGEKTIVLSAESSQILDELAGKADLLQLPCFLVHDDGRTEVAPGSKTVLAVAGMSEFVDSVTGRLRLLK
eukprot:jgi/Botrbrau1/19838/Bobra.0124s0075.1